MREISTGDGVYSRSNVFDNVCAEEDPIHPDLRAVLDEYHGTWLAGAMTRVALEMRQYGLDPTTDEGQQTAARVLRERLVHKRDWLDGSVESYQQRADIENAGDTEFVYYVDLYGSAVKIGYSANVTKRLIGLRRRLVHVLALEPGGRAQEALRHRQFRDEQIENVEDFTRSDRLMAHIDSIRAKHGDPAAMLEAVGRAKRTAC